MTKRFLFTLFIFCLVLLQAGAQEQEIRSLLYQKFSVSSHFNMTIDGGNFKGVNDANWNRWGIRSQGQYKVNNTITIATGFMYNNTKKSDNSIKKEYRPHQTVSFNHARLRRFSVRHRLKMEERFYTYDNNNTTSSRLRYQLKTKRAFNLDNKIKPKTPYCFASSEFFFNPAGKIKNDYILYNRTRAGLGLGYQLSSNLFIESTIYIQRSHSNTNFEDHTDLTIFNFYIKNNSLLHISGKS